jgi:nitrogenase molybdenum-iron protein alpha/beta subunit
MLGRMGLTVNCHFLSHSDSDSLKRFRSGSINIMMANDRTSSKVAEMIRERTGAFVFPLSVPSGFHETVGWLRLLGKEVGRKAQAEELVEEMEDQYHRGVSAFRPTFEGK